MTDPTQNTPPDTVGVEPIAWLVEDLLKLNRPPIFATDCRRHVDGIYSDPAEFKITPLVPADALEAATARADKAEADARTLLRLANEAADVMNRAVSERDAALSRVTDLERALRRIEADEAYLAVPAALAQSSGADPAQGGEK